jgi:hypothetical protein
VKKKIFGGGDFNQTNFNDFILINQQSIEIIKKAYDKEVKDALEKVNSPYGAYLKITNDVWTLVQINSQEEYDEYVKSFETYNEIPNYYVLENSNLSFIIIQPSQTPTNPLSITDIHPNLNEFKNAIPNSLVSFGGSNKTRRTKNRNKNKSRKVRKTKRQNQQSNKCTKKHKKIIKHKKSRSNI